MPKDAAKTEKQRAAVRRYAASDKGKETRARYQASDEGQALAHRARARNAIGDDVRSALSKASHPEHIAEYNRQYHFEHDPHPAPKLSEAFDPLRIKSDNILVAPDWHIPFHDREFAAFLLRTAKEFDVHELAVPGDFWDCDNYSHFVHLSWGETFKEEITEVRTVLEILVDNFDTIYFCKGNHEMRWIELNWGRMGMKELFAITGVPDEHYKVTLDDHMILESGDQKWLLSHGRNFRVTNLSVAKDLAAKYMMNILCAHGHQWAQGVDRSGKFALLDGGGMFDPYQLEYLRQTNAYPAVQGGFYLIQDGRAIPFKNDNPLHRLGRWGKEGEGDGSR